VTSLDGLWYPVKSCPLAVSQAVCNDNGFRKQGTSHVLKTTKFVCVATKLTDNFCTVLTSYLGCFKTSTVSDVFSDFVSKLTNTSMQEFLDSYKATSAIKNVTASVSGQNLQDTLLAQHVNSKKMLTSQCMTYLMVTYLCT